MSGGQKKKSTGPRPELTEEQKQEIREAFDLFDTDGSGIIIIILLLLLKRCSSEHIYVFNTYMIVIVVIMILTFIQSIN